MLIFNYGFREGRGTGTAKLEAKLVQQLTRIAHEPLFQVFLDVRKVYDSPAPPGRSSDGGKGGWGGTIINT